jgi:hypothetical protein
MDGRLIGWKDWQAETKIQVLFKNKTGECSFSGQKLLTRFSKDPFLESI